MRSLVTGGAGFIGSNLVDALVTAGDRVTVIDDLTRGRIENLAAPLSAGAVLVKADVRDGTAITRVREASPKRVFHLPAHLPAQASVARSGRDPGFDAAVNVGKTVNLLEAARCAGADVVGHEDGHELGPRSPHSGIQRASEPATLVDDQIHARVTQDIAQQVLEARPLSVLDDHQRVPVRRRLVHVGAEGRAQKARVVEPSGAAGWSGGATSASAASV